MQDVHSHGLKTQIPAEPLCGSQTVEMEVQNVDGSKGLYGRHLTFSGSTEE